MEKNSPIYVAFLSGLDAGSGVEDSIELQLLRQFLCGELGSETVAFPCNTFSFKRSSSQFAKS